MCLIQIMLNPDWYVEVHDIMLFQIGPAHFKPARRAQTKKHGNLKCKITKSVPALAENTVHIVSHYS